MNISYIQTFQLRRNFRIREQFFQLETETFELYFRQTFCNNTF